MHPLFGPRERINRANAQTVTLQEKVQAFFRDNLYEIGVAKYNPKADNYSLRVKSGPQEFPVEWSLLIGEITHNLRAALDGLTWQLALLETGTPYDRTAFPVYLLGRTTRRRRGNPLPHFWSSAHGLRLIKSVPKRLWARIESFQPYKRGNGGRHSPLFRLDQLNNTDKHRLLTVLDPGAASLEFQGFAGRVHFNHRVSLRMNAKVGWVRDIPRGVGRPIKKINIVTGQMMDVTEMEVDVRVAPHVRFGDSCEAVQRLVVIPSLQRIASEVSRIVESFADEFQ